MNALKSLYRVSDIRPSHRNSERLTQRGGISHIDFLMGFYTQKTIFDVCLSFIVVFRVILHDIGVFFPSLGSVFAFWGYG